VRAFSRLVEWLRATPTGLLLMALLVGIGAGFGAVGFRYLIYGVTWLWTGQVTFGQQSPAISSHLSALGPAFVLLATVAGGLVIGPLIYFFAREARGHGVPEVMLAVAEVGGRIRPQVTVVKALASAICIGSGGSVGREGPIVQIGSALASTFGQAVRMSDSRLRVLVACGAAGGISATFNAPLAGVFFGLELILREVSLEAFVATLAASMTADTIAQSFFGNHPFFAGLQSLQLPNAGDDALCALLGGLAGLVGIGFKWVLYRVEDWCDALWRGRPEWLRPAVGGVPLGLLLMAVPQMYGVGYPVLQQALGGAYVAPFLVLLVAAKIVAASLTIGIGGSGGVFAPSLFMGASLGTGYGMLFQHVLGAGAGPPAAYGLVAMGAVFAGAARAPLTATSAVLEMTGDFGMVLPVMLATAMASAASARLSHGTIYTTKLLRRNVDIERPKPATLMQVLTVADAMRSVGDALQAGARDVAATLAAVHRAEGSSRSPLQKAAGPPAPRSLFENETLEQAVRQLALYGHRGLPVVAEDDQTILGWVTNRDVMRTFARRLGQTIEETERGHLDSTEPGGAPDNRPRYRLVTATLLEPGPRSLPVENAAWPATAVVVAVHRDGTSLAPDDDGTSLAPDDATRLAAGDKVTVLVPESESEKVTRLVAGAGRADGERPRPPSSSS
jgi:CIC family chloride channel protein